jgi:hypothetical protein
VFKVNIALPTNISSPSADGRTKEGDHSKSIIYQSISNSQKISLNLSMHSNNHYNKNLKEFARKLRTETVSKAEKLLWKSIFSRFEFKKD